MCCKVDKGLCIALDACLRTYQQDHIFTFISISSSHTAVVMAKASHVDVAAHNELDYRYIAI